MSLRLFFVLSVLVLGVAGCSSSRINNEPVGKMSYGEAAMPTDPSDYIDGEVYHDGDKYLSEGGSAQEDAIIEQARLAPNGYSVAEHSLKEDSIIAQAMVADDAMPVHRATYSGRPFARNSVRTPDIAMQEIRKHKAYKLDSGDRVRLFVYGQPNLSRSYSVDGSGFISVPLIGAVRARGATTHGLERSIGDLLATQYVKDPQVSVQISQYRPFFILGEVTRSGQYPFVNGMNVETAVAIAGGFSARAREKSVQLTRVINGYRSVVEVAPNEPVYPGDTIKVHERFF